MTDAVDNLHNRFCAWCKRVGLPRKLDRAADILGDFLLIAKRGEIADGRPARSAAKAAAKIEAWKARE